MSPAEARRWPLERTLARASVRLRVLAIVGVFIVVLVVLGVFASLSASRERESATVNNVAGRQGMLAQRLVKEALLRSEGFTVDLEGTVEQLRANATAVVDGGQVKPVQGNDGELTIPGQHDPAVRAKLLQESALVERLITGSMAVSTTSPDADGYRAAVVQLEALSHVTSNVAADALGRATAGSRAATDSAVHRDIALAVVGMLVAIACSALVLRSLLRPLREAARLSDAVQAGDLTGHLDVDSSDDLGRMSKGLNAAVTNLRTTMDAIGAVAGELSTTAVQLESSSGEIRRGAESNVGSTRDVGAKIGLLDVAVGHAVDEVERVRAETRAIASHAQAAAEVAAQAMGDAAAIADTIRELRAASDTVESVVGLISSIAEQTNLLALNATIEAARAGEVGKGFAVVAGEVKQLAQQTADATTRVTQSIAAIRDRVDGAVAASSQVGQVIATISERQRAITTAVDEQIETAGAIGRSVDEVRAVSAEISAVVSGITADAEHNLSVAQQTDDAASGLGEAARALQELMAAYRY